MLLLLHLRVFSSCARARVTNVRGSRIPRRCTSTNANSMTANSAGCADGNARAGRFYERHRNRMQTRTLVSEPVAPARTVPTPSSLPPSDGSGRGCLLITGKHYPSSPFRGFQVVIASDDAASPFATQKFGRDVELVVRRVVTFFCTTRCTRSFPER